jgi:hypothetical protein
MLGAVKLNRIICNIDRSDVVTVKHHGHISQQPQLLQQAF